MLDKVRNTYNNIIKQELVAALGCTEPIAIAFCCAKAREVLGSFPKKCIVYCSGNIIKNVMGVTVPNSKGLKGIDVAATLGIIANHPEKDLEVLSSITDEDISLAKQLLKDDFCSCFLQEGVENLYIKACLYDGDNSSVVEITNSHKNITLIQKNSETIYSSQGSCLDQRIEEKADKSLLNIADILEYGDTLHDEDIIEILKKQLSCNCLIAQKGLEEKYGVQVGRTLLKSAKQINQDNARIIAKAYTAAGSDARMNGCALPVVINSGSGNQGLTVSLPVWVYAKLYNIDSERMIKALAISNLISIHQKKYIGALSAYCGAASAACGAGCGIAYLLAKDLSLEQIYQQIADTITDTIATIGGMVCDGAKSSCAAKIAVALDCAITAYELSCEKLVFQPGEGLVKKDVEKTIEAIGKMGKDGMRSTDNEILGIMLEKNN